MILSTLLPFLAMGQATAPKPLATVPFHRAETAMIVDAEVNGFHGSFMFDTGFAGSFVLGSQYDVGPATGEITLRDFVGELQAKSVKLKSLKVGSLDIKCDADLVQQESEDISDSYGTHCNGIMGLSVFKNEIFEINFQRNEMYFYPKSYDISKKVADNKKTFLLKMLPMGHNSIELLVKSKTDQEFILALDTGNSFYATTYRETLEEAGLWPKDKKPDFLRQSFVASGAVPSFTARLEDVRIFDVPVGESYWDIINLPSSSADSQGTVGFGFLKNFNITVDMNRRRVWLEKINENVGNEAEADLGMVALYDPTFKGVTVYQVTPKGPAEKAGIKPLDIILSVDGTEMVKQSYSQMRRLFDGPHGSTAKLVCSRKGVTQRYEVKRDWLINLMPAVKPAGDK